MTYTPITDEKGVKDAFARLQTLFHEGAKGTKEFPHHRKLNLSGEIREAPKDLYKRYIFQFWHDKGPKFMASVRPKIRDRYGSRGVSGLFVRDERGHRFLTHDGRFSGIKKSSDKFRQFHSSGDWIDVEQVPNQRFVISQIDNISAPALVNRISNVLGIVLDFRVAQDHSANRRVLL